MLTGVIIPSSFWRRDMTCDRTIPTYRQFPAPEPHMRPAAVPGRRPGRHPVRLAPVQEDGHVLHPEGWLRRHPAHPARAGTAGEGSGTPGLNLILGLFRILGIGWESDFVLLS